MSKATATDLIVTVPEGASTGHDHRQSRRTLGEKLRRLHARTYRQRPGGDAGSRQSVDATGAYAPSIVSMVPASPRPANSASKQTAGRRSGAAVRSGITRLQACAPPERSGHTFRRSVRQARYAHRRRPGLHGTRHARYTATSSATTTKHSEDEAIGTARGTTHRSHSLGSVIRPPVRPRRRARQAARRSRTAATAGLPASVSAYTLALHRERGTVRGQEPARRGLDDAAEPLAVGEASALAEARTPRRHSAARRSRSTACRLANVTLSIQGTGKSTQGPTAAGASCSSGLPAGHQVLVIEGQTADARGTALRAIHGRRRTREGQDEPASATRSG